jgi:hypothetical protein
MTPNCLRRLMSPYGARVTGFQGYHAFPHTVMGVGIKAPIPADSAARLARLVADFAGWRRRAESSLPVGVKLRRAVAQIYRSKGERRQVADYYAAELTIEIDPSSSPEGRQRFPLESAA